MFPVVTSIVQEENEEASNEITRDSRLAALSIKRTQSIMEWKRKAEESMKKRNQKCACFWSTVTAIKENFPIGTIKIPFNSGDKNNLQQVFSTNCSLFCGIVAFVAFFAFSVHQLAQFG